MSPEEFKDLGTGDIIKHVNDKQNINYVVTANYGGHVIAVRTVELTNPTEWVRTHKANHDKTN